eukprot:scaffold322887_cov15-Prasinocladus_malaysianus.AAC.1
MSDNQTIGKVVITKGLKGTICSARITSGQKLFKIGQIGWKAFHKSARPQTASCFSKMSTVILFIAFSRRQNSEIWHSFTTI